MKNTLCTHFYNVDTEHIEEHPDIRQLSDVMRIKNIGITVRWYDLGLELVDDDNILQLIKADHGNDNNTCCRAMFQKWLEKITDPSWNHLVYGTLSNMYTFKLQSFILQCLSKVY